jgi:hypothetical protein
MVPGSSIVIGMIGSFLAGLLFERSRLVSLLVLVVTALIITGYVQIQITTA